MGTLGKTNFDGLAPADGDLGAENAENGGQEARKGDAVKEGANLCDTTDENEMEKETSDLVIDEGDFAFGSADSGIGAEIDPSTSEPALKEKRPKLSTSFLPPSWKKPNILGHKPRLVEDMSDNITKGSSPVLSDNVEESEDDKLKEKMRNDINNFREISKYGDEYFTCKPCNYTTVRKVNFISHYQVIHGEIIEDKSNNNSSESEENQQDSEKNSQPAEGDHIDCPCPVDLNNVIPNRMQNVPRMKASYFPSSPSCPSSRTLSGNVVNAGKSNCNLILGP